MNRLAHGVVAAKAERYVAYPARNFSAWQIGFNPAHRFNKIDRVVVVLFNACSHGKDVGVENNILRRKAHFIHQYAVGTLANLNLARARIGLALLVKSHYHGSRAITLNQLGVLLELLNAFFHRDGVHNALALQAAQPCLNHLPLGAIHHHRHAGNIGLAGHQVQKPHHGRLAIEHGLIHVYVNDLSAVFYLLARHCQGFFVLPVENHAGKGFGARNVGTLAHVYKQGIGINGQRLKASQAQW